MSLYGNHLTIAINSVDYLYDMILTTKSEANNICISILPTYSGQNSRKTIIIHYKNAKLLFKAHRITID